MAMGILAKISKSETVKVNHLTLSRTTGSSVSKLDSKLDAQWLLFLLNLSMHRFNVLDTFWLHTGNRFGLCRTVTQSGGCLQQDCQV
jgi:hypothetical protein